MSNIQAGTRPTKRIRLASQHALPRHTSHPALDPGLIVDAMCDDILSTSSGVSGKPEKFEPGREWEATPVITGDVLPLISTEGISLCPSTLEEIETHSHSGSPYKTPEQLLTDSPLSPPVTSGAQRTIDIAADARRRDRLRGCGTKTTLASPFTDCVDSFGNFDGARYFRPMDGKVNGYLKFYWPQAGHRKVERQIIQVTEGKTKPNNGGKGEDLYCRKSSFASDNSPRSNGSRDSSAGQLSTIVSWPPRSSTPLPDLQSNLAISPTTSHSSSPTLSSPPGMQQMRYFTESFAEAPRKTPPHFGHDVAMDHIDRKFWTFYIQNWCPGRSILPETNLWLAEFARMHRIEGIRAAIQSLAGIYIYDYQPEDIVRRRVNKLFAAAESRLSYLLRHSASLQNHDFKELITLACILSMQDIVLTERRLKRPYNPRWLRGFQQAEHFLQATDTGHRFWRPEHVQFDSLRNSQAIIVGRGVILAQPMMPLPAIATFDAHREVRRFGWLLYGSKKDMYEIHGGCGFSKRLLHIFSQVTYCVARLQQDPESIVVPKTAEYLYAKLRDLRQWSQESNDWHVAKGSPPPISWVRNLADNYVIQTPCEMTDVTAEAWRIAGLLYLQCRLMRLRRNDPVVISYLGDLAKCISIMPTSGFIFTAQAPLLPVFFLGLLATVPEHRAVAIRWFEQVMDTPVRSSVPPLYDALKRILGWFPNEIKATPPSKTSACATTIVERHAWWETMVSKVQKKEPEVLCLT